MHRFGLIGDVHAEDDRLEAALHAFVIDRVDRILCVGDLADGQGDLDRCVALLREHDVTTVRGNHDRWLLDGQMRNLDDSHDVASLATKTRDYIAALPTLVRIETSGGPLLLCHGFGKDDMLEAKSPRAIEFQLVGSGYSKHESLARLGIEPDVRILVAGHTHQRMATNVDQFFIANPGTLHREHEPGFAILETSQSPQVRFFNL